MGCSSSIPSKKNKKDGENKAEEGESNAIEETAVEAKIVEDTAAAGN